jgi:hypothetical protein
LNNAVQQNEIFPDAYRLLAVIHAQRSDYIRAAEHRALAEVAQKRFDDLKSGATLPEDRDLQLDIAMDQPIGIGTIGAETSSGANDDSIIVVSGLPRSGTSMMMQMLAAGGIAILTDGERPADESNPRGYFEFEPVKKLGKQNDWVENAGGKAVKIVAQLLPKMPPKREKRIIFMARPLGEIVGSQTQMLQRLGRKGAAMSDRQLAAVYKKQVESLSKSLARRTGLTAITIDYTDAIADPQSTARRVNQFLGGTLDEQAMAAVIDRSLYRARLT